MKQRYILTTLLGLAMATMSAQINEATSLGFMQRAKVMYADENYKGCIDQMLQAKQGKLLPSDVETADYYVAMSTFCIGDDDAINLIEAFVRQYPSSAYRVEMAMAAGDYHFTRHQYALALSRYNAINQKQLNEAHAEDCCYRVAYSKMKLADYDEALQGFDSLTATDKYGHAAEFYKGYIAYAKGDYREAEVLLSNVDKTRAPGNMADYYLCQMSFAREDYEKALVAARSLESKNVDLTYKTEAMRIAGESLFNLGHEDDAEKYISRYVAMSDNPLPSALYVLGVCEYRNGDYEQAIEHLSEAVNCENKTGQGAYLYLGQCNYRRGDKNAALLAFEKAANMGYDSAINENALYNYVTIKAQDGNVPFAQCVESAEIFLMRFPASQYVPQVREYVVKGLMANNDYERALLSIATYDNPSDEIMRCKQQTLFTLATRDVGAGRVKQALTRFKQARDIKPGNQSVAAECRLWIGDCLYREGKYAEAAESYLDYLSNITPSHQNCAMAYYNLGYSRFQQERYGDAEVNFKRVVKNRGNLSSAHVADAYNRIGDCYYYESKFDLASKYYNKAIDINPSSGDYALYQNALMRGHNRDYKGKIDDLNEIVKRFPSSDLIPSVMLEKAETYTALNDNENAINTYRQLVKEYPKSSQSRKAMLQMAITYSNMGNNDNAIDAYKRVITDYPDSEEARVAAEDLKRVLADEGRLNEYLGFVKNVPDAPQIDESELNQLTFNAAEKSYLNGGGLKLLTEYVNQYPDGKYKSQALYYMCQAAAESGNDTQALKYATEIVEQYEQSPVAEDALAVKADIEYRKGLGKEALASYSRLAKIATVPHNAKSAHMGIMRVSRDLSMHNQVIEAADRLLASDAVQEAEKGEILFARAYALNAVGRSDEAVVEWASLATNPDDLIGAKSAYYLGQYYYDKGDLNKSRQVVEALIDANTPHQYWLARSFILLSDIYRKEGMTFEANEYLKTIKETYPGSETDIFIMIEQRLK